MESSWSNRAGSATEGSRTVTGKSAWCQALGFNHGPKERRGFSGERQNIPNRVLIARSVTLGDKLGL
jgi:hypothetical protein